MTPPIEFIEDAYLRHGIMRRLLAEIAPRRAAAALAYDRGIFTYGDLDREYQQITMDEECLREDMEECERQML